MAFDLQHKKFTFPSATGGPQLQRHIFRFDSPIRKADAAITSYNCEFNGDDHPLQKLQVSAFVDKLNGPEANVIVVYGMKDNSGTYDDPYSGEIDIVVIADLV